MPPTHPGTTASWPRQTTILLWRRTGPPYTRPIVPEDYAPGGKPAIPPGVTVPAPDESLRKKTDDESDGGGNEYKRRFLSTTT
jgi:hypothetical protein